MSNEPFRANSPILLKDATTPDPALDTGLTVGAMLGVESETLNQSGLPAIQGKTWDLVIGNTHPEKGAYLLLVHDDKPAVILYGNGEIEVDRSIPWDTAALLFWEIVITAGSVLSQSKTNMDEARQKMAALAAFAPHAPNVD